MIKFPFEMVKILLILSLSILDHGLTGVLQKVLRFYAISSRKCNFHQDTRTLCELKSDIHQTLPGNSTPPPPKKNMTFECEAKLDKTVEWLSHN